jgi:hypothetical protein
MILICIHGRTFWFDPPISIDTQLLSWIMGLEKEGEGTTPVFTNKAGIKALAESMKDKFHTFKGKRGLDVTNISDDVVHFEM